jgi:hypothetical protein
MTAEIQSLREALAETRRRLLAAISGVGEADFKKRPPAGEGEGPNWCIAEVLAHLLQQERLRAERMRSALDRPGEAITPSSDEADYEAARAGRAAPVPQIIHGLLASRREVELLLERAAGAPGGLDSTVLHPRLGPQTVRWLLREKIIAHEAEHVDQVEAIKRRLEELKADNDR